jgi:hypothetical protein
MERYLIILHDLEDFTIYATKEHDLYQEADASYDLCKWVHEEGNIEKLEEIEDPEGITILGLTYGLQY